MALIIILALILLILEVFICKTNKKTTILIRYVQVFI